MVVARASEITVFDNLTSRPPSSGPGQRYSMSVLFSVAGVLYYGQLCFDDQEWTTTPGDEHKRTFPDRVVEYWFLPPNTYDLFKKYKDGVLSGRCRDETSRLDPYIPEDERGGLPK
jgi:hypothetical protein